MSLKWNRPQYREQEERKKAPLTSERIVPIKLKWVSRCTGCNKTIQVNEVASYDPQSKAKFCAVCLPCEGKETGIRSPVRSDKLAAQHLEVRNGRLVYVDDEGRERSGT